MVVGDHNGGDVEGDEDGCGFDVVVVMVGVLIAVVVMLVVVVIGDVWMVG